MEDFIASYDREIKERKDIALNHNKPIIFDALQASGITSLTITFDGEGDDGQIGDITADEGDLPDITVIIKSRDYDHQQRGFVWQDKTTTLLEACEDLAYELLAAEHGGWENNDGAFGDFVFHVATRVIDLNFNYRVASSVFEGSKF